jgi:deoxyribodipyrimidine photo-lyase
MPAGRFDRSTRRRPTVLTLLWLHRDLRLEDNPALEAALAQGAVLPVYIHDEAAAGAWVLGGASRWWLHGSLESLGARLAARGNRLILRRGASAAVLGQLLEQTGAQAVAWNRRFEPWARALSDRVARDLARRGVPTRVSNGALLIEPEALATQKGEPFRVFTPFWRALRARLQVPAPRPLLSALAGPARYPASEALAGWQLRPARPDWAAGLREAWTPGEPAALARLAQFADRAAFDYAQSRDLPGTAGTSRLSPHLHFGEIGPRQIWRALARCADPMPKAVETFLAEIAWREFSYHLLFHFPTLPEAPLRPEFAAFAWEPEGGALRAWQQGRTGYPIVDAGLRELWHTGWMHNRVRMIAASFLVKDLLLPWGLGARWFWDTLVDADLASNSASWQWVAGCGADAAPFFRVFNPALQGAKFDADGAYVRRWVPELRGLPTARLHAPWLARPIELAAAGVELGRSYPPPLVDHAFARQRALRAFQEIRHPG